METVMKEIKMVVCDIDDTLITEDCPFPPQVADAVKELQKAGILFTFASGRQPQMINPYLKELCLDMPVVACNGALVYHKKRILFHRPIPVKPLIPLIEKADQSDMTILYCLQQKEYTLRETDYVRQRIKEAGSYHPVRPFSPTELETAQLDKLVVMDKAGNIPKLQPLIETLKHDYSFTRYGDIGLEIVSGEVNKAFGIQIIAKQMGICLNQVMAIGDNENDNLMLRIAGLGIAVGNALPQTKECADYVCVLSGPDGVVEAIEQFCLRRNRNAAVDINEYSV